MTTLPQNLIPNEPQLKDLLDLYRKNISLALNCHHIGTVGSFDPIKQTATATINYKKVYSEPDAAGVYHQIQKDYPLLVDCPVICLGGGPGSLTFPIAEGDECLVLFNDRDFDNWFAGSSSSPPATPRLHSYADGIILVGVRSLANVLQGYDSENVVLQLKNGVKVTFRAAGGFVVENAIGNFTFEDNADVNFDTGTVVGLFGSGGKVKFQNTVGELINALYTLFTTGEAGGFPFVLDPTALATLLSFKV